MEKQILYFIALIPPENISNEIISFKQDLAHRFESKAALRVVPHITLKAPFKLDSSHHTALLNWFHGLVIPKEKIEIELQNFGSFPKQHAPVIFVHPLPNAALAILQRIIVQNFHNHFPQIELLNLEKKFHPHMTIAYRDMTFEKFKEAWKEYSTKEFHASFCVENFYLLQHDTKKWNVIAEKKF